jgi:hypothetical protein
MFGIGLIELIFVGGMALFMFAVPIVIIVLLVRLVAIKEKNDQRPGP